MIMVASRKVWWGVDEEVNHSRLPLRPAETMARVTRDDCHSWPRTQG